MNPSNSKKVGTYQKRFNDLTQQSIPCGNIYQSDGLLTHVQRRHPNIVQDLPLIPQIIAAPDYVGHNPKEPNSIELVQALDANRMVCIKLDERDNTLYVASFYTISLAKLNNRLNSGRLKKY